MNIETAAQAICRTEHEMDGDYPWDVQFEDGKEVYRGLATAAIDAYRTLTDDQWEAQQDSAARDMHVAEVGRIGGGLPWDNITPTARTFWLTAADAAMRAVGFRRSDEEDAQT